MLTGPNVILVLKIAVSAVTLLLLLSLLALARGNRRLHGRINIVFFVLTISALLALEVIVRLIDPTIFDYFDVPMQRNLTIHFCFAIPSACLLPLMLYTGLRQHREIHIFLAGMFSALWIGTFISGVFFLSHH
ncbi:MAG: hypothetical protein KatS3mg105_1374 [Gemmatales bacterium]|nr:MAG: hypothetical protein KatS3mg105_1374 [Gemmatales bacterium]